eukprot:jgi/Psemu1/309538/fgenesh1_kg.521_\
MMTAWAFLGEVRSVGVEAQEISFGCLQRGLEWNLGSRGTSPNDVVQIRHTDLRTWDGCGIGIDIGNGGSTNANTSTRASSSGAGGSAATAAEQTSGGGGGGGDDTQDPPSSSSSSLPSLRPPYRLITGTPPYFPTDSFVASQNHEQKVRCRVPTRGGAPDYIETASRFLLEEGCDETKTETGEEGVFCMVEAAFDKAEAGVLAAV